MCMPIQKFFSIIFILCLLKAFVIWACLSKNKPKYTHQLKSYEAVFAHKHYNHVGVVSLGEKIKTKIIHLNDRQKFCN